MSCELCVIFFKLRLPHSVFLFRITSLVVFSLYSANRVGGLSVHVGLPLLFADETDVLQILQ